MVAIVAFLYPTVRQLCQVRAPIYSLLAVSLAPHIVLDRVDICDYILSIDLMVCFYQYEEEYCFSLKVLLLF